MTVYGDILVIVNLYIDFFLLRCVKKALKFRVRNLRLAGGALLGAVLSLTALLPSPSPVLSLLWSLLTALGIAAAAFCPLTFRGLFRAALCFWAFSLGLAGFFLFLIRYFAPAGAAVMGNVIYFDLSLPLLFLFTAAAYLILRLAQKLLSGVSSATRFLTLQVEEQGVTVRLLAKADTGNSLREPFSGLPVILCREESLKSAAPPEVLEFLETGARGGLSLPRKGLRLVPYDSVGGAGVLPAFRPGSVRSAKTGAELSCWLALCRRSFPPGEFDALYNPDAFPDC